jgi:hypothetical protein
MTQITDKKAGARKNGQSGDREKSCVKNAKLNAPSREAGFSYQRSAFGFPLSAIFGRSVLACFSTKATESHEGARRSRIAVVRTEVSDTIDDDHRGGRCFNRSIAWRGRGGFAADDLLGEAGRLQVNVDGSWVSISRRHSVVR